MAIKDTDDTNTELEVFIGNMKLSRRLFLIGLFSAPLTPLFAKLNAGNFNNVDTEVSEVADLTKSKVLLAKIYHSGIDDTVSN